MYSVHSEIVQYRASTSYIGNTHTKTSFFVIIFNGLHCDVLAYTVTFFLTLPFMSRYQKVYILFGDRI